MSALQGPSGQLTGVPVSTAGVLNLGFMVEPQGLRTTWYCTEHTGCESIFLGLEFTV